MDVSNSSNAADHRRIRLGRVANGVTFGVLVLSAGMIVLIAWLLTAPMSSPEQSVDDTDILAAAPRPAGPAVPLERFASLPVSYTLPVAYGDLAPQLVAAGVLYVDALADIFARRNVPLDESQLRILREASETSVTIDASNSEFILDFFWAVGLANRNAILLEGAMQQHGTVTGFASVGGWTVATRPIAELYAALPLIELTPAQQDRLQAVTSAIYRPCCDNATDFPDCNHGMALLGLLELMASRDASTDEMFDAAKNVSAFWFPKEMRAVTAYFRLTEGTDFAGMDSRRALAKENFSASGAAAIRKWLVGRGVGDTVSPGGAFCGV